ALFSKQNLQVGLMLRYALVPLCLRYRLEYSGSMALIGRPPLQGKFETSKSGCYGVSLQRSLLMPSSTSWVFIGGLTWSVTSLIKQQLILPTMVSGPSRSERGFRCSRRWSFKTEPSYF